MLMHSCAGGNGAPNTIYTGWCTLGGRGCHAYYIVNMHTHPQSPHVAIKTNPIFVIPDTIHLSELTDTS